MAQSYQSWVWKECDSHPKAHVEQISFFLRWTVAFLFLSHWFLLGWKLRFESALLISPSLLYEREKASCVHSVHGELWGPCGLWFCRCPVFAPVVGHSAIQGGLQLVGPVWVLCPEWQREYVALPGGGELHTDGSLTSAPAGALKWEFRGPGSDLTGLGRFSWVSCGLVFLQGSRCLAQSLGLYCVSNG